MSPVKLTFNATQLKVLKHLLKLVVRTESDLGLKETVQRVKERKGGQTEVSQNTERTQVDESA